VRRGLRLLSTLLVLGAAAPAAGFLWFVQRAAMPPDPPAAEAPGGAGAPGGIAVLTGGPDRVEAGLALLAARPGARLIISGTGRDATLPDLIRESGVLESGALESRALEAGAPRAGAAGPAPASLADPFAARVTLGREAVSTRGNAREVAAWSAATGLEEITVVTAGFHMPRALLELRRALPGAVLHPHPVAPFLARPVPMLREYAKLIGAALGLSRLIERRRPPAGPAATTPAAPAPSSGGPAGGAGSPMGGAGATEISAR